MQPIPPSIKKHPNASLSATGGGVGILVVYIIGVFGVAMDNEVAGAVVTISSSTLLLIGRRGLKGIWHMILHGSDDGD